jgi:hypothetical protein
MKLEVYHQLGFRFQWNFQSIKEDGTGDGVILAPRYIGREYIEALNRKPKKKAIFDPQFFLPDTARGKLCSYEFFPCITGDGFETTEYVDKFAFDCAEKCVDFQLQNDFRYIVIPTRYKTGMPTDFIKSQEIQFIEPFLKAIRERRVVREIVLQLVLNDDMIKDEEYSSDLLNWITGYDEIAGVYLITEVSSRSKQIKDIDFLFSYLNFINALNMNELKVILGYLNCESILLSIANPHIVTIGSYENTRRFNISAFEDREDPRQFGPTARIYISKLLQWMDHRYIGSIKRVKDYSDIFDKNAYQAEMFESTFNWHFAKPQLYMHYFLVFSEQLRGVSNAEGSKRYKKVCSILENAINNYSVLGERILFDPDSDGSHLYAWHTAANMFAAEQGWR